VPVSFRAFAVHVLSVPLGLSLLSPSAAESAACRAPSRFVRMSRLSGWLSEPHPDR